jgi:hypothetical protein
MCFHGERLDTHTGLYQMMPLKLRTNLDEQLKGWTAGRNIRVENLDQRPHLLGQRMETGSCFQTFSRRTFPLQSDGGPYISETTCSGDAPLG